VAAASAAAAVVGAVDDRQSDEDDPEALVVEKITDAVHSFYGSPHHVPPVWVKKCAAVYPFFII